MLLRLTVVVLAALLGAACASVGTERLPGKPAHHVEGGFRNPDPGFSRPSGWTRWSFFTRRVLASIFAQRVFDAPRMANDGAELRAGTSNPGVTWVGHSTLLVQVDGLNILTDPHWGDRASPVSWAGPKRLNPPGLAFEALPPIHVVVISHDHYDHLDLDTVKRLAETHDPLFLVPLGLKPWFADHGMTRVEELDWWEEREHRGVRFVCVPAQHFSQRGLGDRNARLWASWAVLARERRLYFGGDTGYFSGFKEAGDRLGPFDLAAIPIGAYVPAEIMKPVHTSPEDAVQAALDLRAHVLLGIHWGTFDMAEEPLDEPPGRMLAEAQRRGIPPERAWILKVGETRRW
ncbi:MAG TPA: MBL fold metallo-hydrolase [Methylomirabilota bacterium]|nr:MBL fold metallo-hydrolase [Methylomirabilota bacterium]